MPLLPELMKIEKSLYESVKADIKSVIAAHNIDLSTQDHGEGLKFMWLLLSIVSRNRAYDDLHPGFVSGAWKRILPYDGRDYCFYYAKEVEARKL